MDKKWLTTEKIAVLAILVNILLAVLKGEMKTEHQNIFLYAMIGVFALFLLIYGLNYILSSKRKGSSKAIIGSCKKYIQKHLIKLVNKTNKKIRKINVIQETASDQKKVLKKLFKVNKTTTNDKLNKLLKDLDITRSNYLNSKNATFSDNKVLDTNNNVRNLINKTKPSNVFKIFEVLEKNIFEMNRILLQVELYDERIKLGKFITKYSIKPINEINAYIDLMGWTYILLGNYKKGINTINIAIRIIDSYLDNKDIILAEDEKYELILLKLRALRHIGTTYYTYNYNKKKCEDSLNEAMKIIEKDDITNYFNRKSLEIIKAQELKTVHEASIRNKIESTLDDNTLSLAKKDPYAYIKMKAGIINNCILSKFFDYVSSDIKDKRILEKLYDDIKICIGSIYINNKCVDQHRLSKLYVLKNQIIKTINNESLNINLTKSYYNDIKDIEEVLNKNVYFDEAIDLYINQKIQVLYDEIKQVIKEDKL